MATQVWLGAAVNIPKKYQVTVGGTWLVGETAVITVNNKSLTLTVGSGQTAITAILDDLVAMVNGDAVNGNESRSAIGSEVGEFAGITATEDGATVLTLTGPDDGRPFTASVSETSASGTFVSAAVASTGIGGAHWDQDANWSSGTAPVDGDDLVFDHRAASDCLYNLDQSAITPASITVTSGFGNHKIGLPDVNTDNPNYPWDESQTTHLTLGTSGDARNIKVLVDAPSSSRIRLNTGSSQATVLVTATGARELPDMPAFDWLGAHASNDVTVDKGDVGIAVGDDQAATVATLRMNYDTNRETDAKVLCGDAVTLGTVTKAGGQLITNSTVTTLTQTGGTTWFKAGRGTAATLATATIRGGVLYYESDGAISTKVTVVGPGAVDFTNDNRDRTVAAIELYAGFTWRDPEGTVTATTGYDFVQCSPQDGKFIVAPNKTWTPSAI